MSTARRPGLLLAAVTLLCLALGAPASAAGTAVPPTIDQIVGRYAMSGKYLNFEYGDGVTYKGSFKSLFTISKTSDTEVLLVWRSAAGEEWSYRGLYRQGVLMIGDGDSATVPAAWLEILVLAFRGSPGKISIAGKYTWHGATDAFFDIETLKGKMLAP